MNISRYGDVTSRSSSYDKPTCVSETTAALVIVNQLHTIKAAGRVTGPGQAFIEIALTVFASESWWAGTGVTAHTVHTLPTIQTMRLPGARPGGAVIHIHLTVMPFKNRTKKCSFAPVDVMFHISKFQKTNH